jgi:3D (Asp-Asp-Asp) domain-containing protein
MQTSILIVLLFCVANGGSCRFVEDARVTEYAPELGGTNCQEPCHLTAYMTPVVYGETAACGPGIPYGTQVFIEGVGRRICQDRGGAIDDDEVDVAVRPEDYMRWGINGHRAVVWVFPQNAD